MIKQNSSGTKVIQEEAKQTKPVKKEQIDIILKELKMKPIKKVTFTEDTIDNEHMNKRKSKSKKFYY